MVLYLLTEQMPVLCTEITNVKDILFPLEASDNKNSHA